MLGAEQAGTDAKKATSLEERLAAAIGKTVDDVAHTECFDREQRAEVYTILKTIRANTETHRDMVKLLASKMKER